jgi:hypothetical protein
MAARFWVGNGSWDATNTANWSATTGGATGASVPTSADTVTFDGNSNNCSVVTGICSTLTISASYGSVLIGPTPAQATITIAGSGTAFIIAPTSPAILSDLIFNLTQTTTATSINVSIAAVLQATNITLQIGNGVSSTATFTLTTNGTFYKDASNYINVAVYSGTLSAGTVNMIGQDLTIYSGTYNPAATTVTLNDAFNVYVTTLPATITFGTSIIYAANALNFDSSNYTGVAATAITTTASATAALRTDTPTVIIINEVGSVAKSSITLGVVGNPASVSSELYISLQYATTTVSLGAVNIFNDVIISGPGAVTLTDNLTASTFSRTGGNLTLTAAKTYKVLLSWVVQGGYTFTPSTSTVNITGIYTNIFNGNPATDITFDYQGYAYGAVVLGGITQTVTNTYNSTNLTCTAFTSTSAPYSQTVTISIASPAVVSFAAPIVSVNSTTTVNLYEGMPVSFTTTGALPTGIAAGTTYYVSNLSGTTCNLASTPGGTAIATTGTQSGVHTATVPLCASQLVLNNNVSAGSGTMTLTGTLVNRLFVRSNVAGTAITMSAAGTKTLTNVDFSDITVSGTAWTGTSVGNCLGNTNITFTPAVTRYAVAGGDWASTAVWSASSGGAGGQTVPLAQDTVIFNAASGSNTFYTNNRRALGASLNMTGFTGTLGINNNTGGGFNLNNSFIYGSLTVPATTTIAIPSGAQGSNIMLAGRAIHTLSIATTLPSGIGFCVYAPNGIYSLANNLIMPLNGDGATTMLVSCGSFSTANGATSYNMYIQGANYFYNYNVRDSSSGDTVISYFMPATNGVGGPAINFNASTITVADDSYTGGLDITQCSTFNGGTSTVIYSPSGFYGGKQIRGTSANRFYNLTLNTSVPTLSNVYANNLVTLNFPTNNTISGQLYFGNVTSTTAIKFSSLTTGNLSSTSIFTTNISYLNVTSTTGTISAASYFNLGGNSGISFIGQTAYAVFSAYNGTFTIPANAQAVNSIEVYGGGGQAGSNNVGMGGAGSGGYSQVIVPNITAGQTIYVNAAASTPKKVSSGSGSTGNPSWINYVSNAQPTSSAQGILATGGIGSASSTGANGGSGSFGDVNINGKGGASGNSGGGGGGSFAYAGGGSTSSTAFGGGGGAGTNAVGNNPAIGSDGAAGGVGTSAGTGGTGGTGSANPTAGGNGSSGGGGGGGGADTRTSQTISTLTRTAGTTTATITTSANHGLTTGDNSYVQVTLLTGTYTRAGTLVTCVVTAGHGLVTSNTPYITITSGAALSGTYTVTVTNSTTFTFNTVAGGTIASSTFTLGESIAAANYTVTVTGTTTFTFVTASSTNIYKISSGTEYPTPRVTAGGDGANNNLISYSYYNGSKSVGTIGLGGGGGGGSGVYSNAIPVGVSGGAGGDGGIAAGGGGGGLSSSIAVPNGGAGGAGLVIVTYTYGVGTSSAFMIG